jgi:hypothetical protein
MRQTRQEKIEQLKQFALIALVAIVCLGTLFGWFFYVKPMLQPVRMENKQHPYFMHYMDEQTKLRSSFNREMTQIGWTHILDFTRAKDDPGMKDGRHVVAEAKKIVDKYIRASQEVDEKTQQALTAAEKTPESKKEALETYTRLVNIPREMVKKTWYMEGQVVDEVEKIIAILSKTPRTWTIKDTNVKFDSPADQAAFDECLLRVQAISLQQDMLRVSAIQATSPETQPAQK